MLCFHKLRLSLSVAYTAPRADEEDEERLGSVMEINLLSGQLVDLEQVCKQQAVLVRYSSAEEACAVDVAHIGQILASSSNRRPRGSLIRRKLCTIREWWAHK